MRRLFTLWLLLMACAIAAAPHLSAQSWRVPRTPDGRPDLQGYWTNMTATPLQRPKEFADKTHLTPAEAAEYERTWMQRLIAAEAEIDQMGADLNEVYLDDRKVVADRRTSLITSPPDGRLPPLVPAAEARRKARPPANADDPEARPLGERCILGLDGGQAVTPPMVPNLYLGNFFQIVQTPGYVMIFAEQIHDARIIRVGGSHTAPSIRRWLGDSIGRWEGDTLVVETTNIKFGYRGATDRLRVVERFSRTGPSTISYVATVDDPDTWTSPWTLDAPLIATASRLFEYACHEGNYGVEGIMRGARADERAAAAKKQ